MRSRGRVFAWLAGAALVALALQLAALLVPFHRPLLTLSLLGSGVPLLLLVACFVFTRWALSEREMHRKRRPLPLRAAGLILVFLLSYLGWGVLQVPLRLCLLVSGDALVAAAESAEPAGFSSYRSSEPAERIGILPVLRVLRSDDGAVYYALAQRPIFVDLITEGLVRDLTDSCTPFGGKHFSSVDLGNGWHWFSVSNDWHC
ncbi:MAG: hypothetical protein DHS20C15_19330 [Planctomycetota bacterium]|nr:MAG: hypothetical protein DHS20C15_19330 [Planctomycetota bacterium]